MARENGQRVTRSPEEDEELGFRLYATLAGESFTCEICHGFHPLREHQACRGETEITINLGRNQAKVRYDRAVLLNNRQIGCLQGEPHAWRFLHVGAAEPSRPWPTRREAAFRCVQAITAEKT
jgi:hypothetical protein